MKKREILFYTSLLALFLLTFSTTAFAIDISGDWNGRIRRESTQSNKEEVRVRERLEIESNEIDSQTEFEIEEQSEIENERVEVNESSDGNQVGTEAEEKSDSIRREIKIDDGKVVEDRLEVLRDGNPVVVEDNSSGVGDTQSESSKRTESNEGVQSNDDSVDNLEGESQDGLINLEIGEVKGADDSEQSEKNILQTWREKFLELKTLVIENLKEWFTK